MGSVDAAFDDAFTFDRLPRAFQLPLALTRPAVTKAVDARAVSLCRHRSKQSSRRDTTTQHHRGTQHLLVTCKRSATIIFRWYPAFIGDFVADLSMARVTKHSRHSHGGRVLLCIRMLRLEHRNEWMDHLIAASINCHQMDGQSGFHLTPRSMHSTQRNGTCSLELLSCYTLCKMRLQC